MKIGYVLKIFPKISEKFVTNEILELIKMGHDVHIFSIYHPNKRFMGKEKIVHDEISEYGLLSKTYYSQYVQRSILELSGYVSLATGHHPDNVLHNGLCTDVASHFASVVKEKGLNLDMIHAHFATEQTFVAIKMSKMLDVPCTCMAHANDIFINPDAKSLREKFENVSAIATPSYYNKDYIHNLTGVGKDKIFVIRACPSIDELKDLKRIEDGYNILSISRLTEKKGIKYGIIAIKELVKEYPGIMYKIIGSGPLEKDLKRLIRSLDIEDNVKIIGNLDNNMLNNEFNKTTAFILPCIEAKNGDMDGIPVSLMEAMYLKIPVISTKLSGIPELIESGVDGLLVGANDSKQLSNAIRILLTNKDLRTKMGNSGRQKIEKDFNISKEVEKLTNIWKEIIEKRNN